MSISPNALSWFPDDEDTLRLQPDAIATAFAGAERPEAVGANNFEIVFLYNIRQFLSLKIFEDLAVFERWESNRNQIGNSFEDCREVSGYLL